MNAVQEKLAHDMMDEAREERRIGLFDMDGSLFDFEGAMRHGLELLHSPDEPPLPANLWELDDVPHMKARMRLIKNQPAWWHNLVLIEDGVRVFEAAKQIGYLPHILTKGPNSAPLAWSEKLTSCQARLGEDIAITITTDKGLTYGTFLYDDHPPYLKAWLAFRPRGLAIMPATVSNAGFTHPQVVRYTGDNFEEVFDALVSAYNRPFGAPLKLKGRG